LPDRDVREGRASRANWEEVCVGDGIACNEFWVVAPVLGGASACSRQGLSHGVNVGVISFSANHPVPGVGSALLRYSHLRL
jgi:hypothetical protein